MSRTSRANDKRNHRIRVHGVRREPADLRRLARALIDLAQAEAEAAAQAEHADQVKEQADNDRTPSKPAEETTSPDEDAA